MWRKVCLILGVLGGHLALLGWLQPAPDHLTVTVTAPALRFQLARPAPRVVPTAPALASTPLASPLPTVANKLKKSSQVAKPTPTEPDRPATTDMAVSAPTSILTTDPGFNDRTGATDLTRSALGGSAAPVVTTPGDPAAPPTVALPSSNADYLNNPAPTYPALSRRLGEQGKVVIRVLIDKHGKPQQGDIRQSSGHSRLDQAALRAVMSWLYVPGRREGVVQDMWFNVPVYFALE